MTQKLTFKNNVKEISLIPRKSGLYYFWQNDKLLYIGKSYQLRHRVKYHYDENQKALHCIFRFKNDVIQHLKNKNVDLALKRYGQITRGWMSPLDYFQYIDLIFNRTTKIEIFEIPRILLKYTEREAIKIEKPLYNIQTRVSDNELWGLFATQRVLNNLYLTQIGW